MLRWLAVIALLLPSLASAQDGLYRLTRRGAPNVRGARITPTRTTLMATQNDNQRYQLQLFYARGECSEVLLAFGSSEIVSEGYGSDDTQCSASFMLDRVQAGRVESALHITRQDRAAIGERVTGTFAPSTPRVRPGEPVEVVITISNPAGAPPIRWRRGGSNRGVRDNQFVLTIERDGVALAAIDGPDFGGLTGMPTLEPGASAEVRASIASWGDISRPGRYVVRCAYETELSSNAGEPFAGPRWDRRFEGVIRFEVR